jgi:hypothetical protein
MKLDSNTLLSSIINKFELLSNLSQGKEKVLLGITK